MRTERERKSDALNRRNFLKLAVVGGIAGGLLIVEEKFKIFESLTKQNPTPTPNPTETPTPTNTPLPTATETPRPTPTPEVKQDLLNLEEQLKSEIENYKGQTAISIIDVTTGEKIDVNGEVLHKPGCVANLLCALTIINELARGTANFTKEEIEDTLTYMVRHSDPSRALQLVKVLGGGELGTLDNSFIGSGVAKINEFREFCGMKRSDYDHPPGCEDIYNQGQENKIVPNELIQVLLELAKGELFPGEWNDYAIWVMKYNKPGFGFMIASQIPEDEADVAHKVGWTEGCTDTINDAGLVLAHDNRFKYAICCFWQGDECPGTQEELFYGVDSPGQFLGKICGISYQTFTTRYGHP